MFHMTIILFFSVILASSRDGGIWNVVCQDSLTGKQESREWTNEQFLAVLALAMGAGEEGYKGYDTVHLYTIAESAVAGFASEVRPIP